MGDPHRAADVSLERFTSLEALVEHAWREMSRGVTDRRHAFHSPVLATVGREGEPEARTVILRAVDVASRVLMCNSDVRSSKVAELRRLGTGGRAAWVFYDAAGRLQVRASGATRVHVGDEVAGARWTATALSSRRCYLGEHSPGAEVNEADPNVPEALRGRSPTLEESLAGERNFAVIATTVERLDVLHLAAEGHARAECVWVDGVERRRWIAP